MLQALWGAWMKSGAILQVGWGAWMKGRTMLQIRWGPWMKGGTRLEEGEVGDNTCSWCAITMISNKHRLGGKPLYMNTVYLLTKLQDGMISFYCMVHGTTREVLQKSSINLAAFPFRFCVFQKFHIMHCSQFMTQQETLDINTLHNTYSFSFLSCLSLDNGGGGGCN